MKQFLIILFASSLFLTCNHAASTDYTPSAYLSETERDTFKYEIIRYADRLPKRTNAHTKFEARFDEEYQRKAKAMKLDKYHVHTNGYTYFQVSKIAPSIHEKHVATGGRLKWGEDGKTIEEYEEIYRTWKMEKAELDKKSNLFFDHMVKGIDLSPYYTAVIGDTKHIEFPDQQTYFNKEARRWETITADSSAAH
ncbi:MAG TPA: hypothetical protein PKA53_08410 [Sphingobacterium sp.]|nr:hypothetical protein [Sphingobacterium sp.]